jgi:hypothetical protein
MTDLSGKSSSNQKAKVMIQTISPNLSLGVSRYRVAQSIAHEEVLRSRNLLALEHERLVPYLFKMNGLAFSKMNGFGQV